MFTFSMEMFSSKIIFIYPVWLVNRKYFLKRCSLNIDNNVNKLDSVRIISMIIKDG